MNNTKDYEEKLLKGWEEIFKRGQLTFWVLLSLRQSPKYMAEIREWIGQVTDNTITVEERSLYRALQRYYDAELVTYDATEGNRGPDRKVYKLTKIGERVLGAFIDRNIRLFLKPAVKKLL
jgi:PadR family transcriptional regulator, regulatory protein PadR